MFENNVVYEYVSKPMEIYKKDYVEYTEEIQMEQGTLDGIYVKPDKKYILYENKKVLSVALSKVQQIHYKQIVLQKNNSFRL